jgi:hypothetical protein
MPPENLTNFVVSKAGEEEVATVTVVLPAEISCFVPVTLENMHFLGAPLNS